MANITETHMRLSQNLRGKKLILNGCARLADFFGICFHVQPASERVHPFFKGMQLALCINQRQRHVGVFVRQVADPARHCFQSSISGGDHPVMSRHNLKAGGIRADDQGVRRVKFASDARDVGPAYTARG
jgi:hypothetical protein